MDRSLRQCDEGSKPEILSRISQTTAALTRLKPVLECQEYFSQLQDTMMCFFIISIFLYACESWTLTAELKGRIQGMEMRCYRKTPEGMLGMSDVSPLSGISGLSLDSIFLSPVLFLCLVLLPFLSFSACWPVLLNFFQKILQYFSLKDRLFCMAPLWQLGEISWLVVCAACCHMTLVFAVMHLYNIFWFFIASVHSFFILILKSGTDKSTQWSAIPSCPSLLCFSNRGDTERTNSSKMLCSMFVYVLFYANLCQDWFCDLWIICGLMTRAE